LTDRAVAAAARETAPAGRQSTLVVGVDGSLPSRWAVRWAAAEADIRQARLVVVHGSDGHSSYDGGDPGSPGSDRSPSPVDDAVAWVGRHHRGVAVQGDTRDRPAAQALEEASRSADLLVVGARGLRGVTSLMGSVSRYCVRHAHCPVVVVGTEPGDPATGGPIVVGTDGSLCSTWALRWALREGRARSVPVHIVFAWQYPPVHSMVMGPPRASGTGARDVLDAAVALAARWEPDVDIQTIERVDAAVSALVDASRGAAMLVLGTRGHVPLHDLLSGSVAHQCVIEAHCPVVTVRPSGGELESLAWP
jgi:nucleotide-binding universal stress UspA family protein